MAKIKRKIIQIDEDKCTGCAACIPSCPEGALKIVETPKGPKARLVKENFCDGLGACLGDCPEDALHVVEEAVDAYDEKGVINHIKKNAPEKLNQHLKHLKEHGHELHQAGEQSAHKDTSACGCPGSQPMSWCTDEQPKEKPKAHAAAVSSELRQWPVQLTLVNPSAPYFKNADLLIAADCVPFACASFHTEFLKGKSIVMGCPKLDDAAYYRDKLVQLFKASDVKSVTVLNMEVPCCFGLQQLVKEAIKASGKKIPYCDITISIKGKVL